jgi:hypothetical protein
MPYFGRNAIDVSLKRCAMVSGSKEASIAANAAPMQARGPAPELAFARQQAIPQPQSPIIRRPVKLLEVGHLDRFDVP